MTLKGPSTSQVMALRGRRQGRGASVGSWYPAGLVIGEALSFGAQKYSTAFAGVLHICS